MHLRLARSPSLNSRHGAVVKGSRRVRSPKTSLTRHYSWKLVIQDCLESLLARRISASPLPLAATCVASHRQPPNICSRPTSSSGHQDRPLRNPNLVSPDLLLRSSRRKHMSARLGGDSLKRHLQHPSPMLTSLILPSLHHGRRTEALNLRPNRSQRVHLLSQYAPRLRPGPYRPYLQRLCNPLTAIARRLQMRTSGATMQLHIKVSLLRSTCFLTSTRSRSSFAVTEQ